MTEHSSIYTPRAEVEALYDATLAQRDAPRGAKGKKSKRAQKRPAKGRALRFIKNALFTLLVVFLCAALFVAVSARKSGELPSLLGFYFLRVQTGSMVPTLPIGSYIITRAVSNPSALSEGDIITFKFEDGAVVTHRVHTVLTNNGQISYITKGDANNVPDETPLTPERVIGKHMFTITLPEIW